MTKDELKDEMKNRISMALKDPILQQGFEIICKNLANLEKENAELKKILEMSNKVYNDNLDYSHHIEEQLTKAKRYIKELLKAVESSYSVLNWQRPPIKAEAEQFLNSEVEK